MLSRKNSSNIQKDTMLIENDHSNQNSNNQIESPSESLEKLNTTKPITLIANKCHTFQNEALEIEKRN